MITLSRKHKIIIAAGLLVLGLVIVLILPMGKKPTLSVPVKTSTKNAVKNKKTVKAASKKTKIADGNQIADSNKPIASGKNTAKSNRLKKDIQVPDSNQDVNSVAVPAPKGSSMIAKQIIAAELAADKQTAAAEPASNQTNNIEESDDDLLINNIPKVIPKTSNLAANLSSNISTEITDTAAQAGIQSLIFMRNMPITDALQLLAIRYKKNIVPTTKVSGNLAFTKLNNVNFEEAMNAILGNEFKYEEQGNIIKVYSADGSSKTKPDSSGMMCKVFTLYYISAAEAKKMITPILSTEGKTEVTTAAATGVPEGDTIGGGSGGGDTVAINDMLVIYDYPEQVAQAEKIISAIDTRPQQVLVEATIMTATLTDGMQFGVDWRNLQRSIVTTLSDVTLGTSSYVGFSGSSTSVGASSLSGGVTIGVTDNDIAAFIKAVESVTDVTILANPKILATNKQLGQVYIGTKLAYQSSTTQTDTSTTQEVSFLDTGTKLSFRPYIGNDGYIRMDIHPKDSSAVIRTVGNPATSTVAMPDETSAELVTNIIVKDGQTIVIGGLFRNKVHTSKTQVPVLGNIPIVGTAFSSTADETKREEVIVLLTPHIIGVPSDTEGDERSDDIARKMMGAKKQLNPLNMMKLAQSHYEKGAVYYVQKRNADALKELDQAIELYPDYLEAIRLKEKIYSEIAPSRKPVREILDQAEETKTHKWRRR